MAQRTLAVIAVVAGLFGTGRAMPAADAKAVVVQYVTQIRRADYEGDRAELKRLAAELGPFVEDKGLAPKVRYWRGFALWRRALNGFNDPATDPKDLAQDLEQALADFDAAAAAAPGFADAKVGAGSCLSNLMYLNRGNAERVREILPRIGTTLQQAEAEDPDNPRLYWVLGPNRWYMPPERGGGQDKAFATYQRGLEAVAKNKGRESDPLDPAWGEPELQMNLAWSNLHRNTPDLDAARSHAESALALVPYWHYVRDLLMPQIVQAIDIREIHKLREKDAAASRSGDFETLKSLFTEDAVVMAPGEGFARGKVEREAMMDRMRETMAQYEAIEYREDFEELTVYGKSAVEWGTIRGKMRDKTTGKEVAQAYKVLRVLSKDASGAWKISRSIYNDLPGGQ